MREIKALKTGKWADTEGPHKPAITMFKGQTYNEKKIPLHMMDHLVGKKFAKDTDDDEPVKKEETGNGSDAGGSGVEQKDIKTVLQEIVESTSGKREAKNALETWAKANLKGFDLDKSKSLKNCIKILVAKHAEQTGD